MILRLLTGLAIQTQLPDSLSRLTTPTEDNEALLSWCHEKSHTVSAILQGSSQSKDELIHHDVNDETEVVLEES